MKKTFGAIFLILGLAVLLAGIATVTNVQTRTHTIEGTVRGYIDNDYEAEARVQNAAGNVAIVIGAILFIIGLGMVVTKSGSQRREEEELAKLKRMQSANAATTPTGNPTTHQNVDNLTAQAINLYNQKDYYSALVVLQRALALSPTNNVTHFNMACLYSLTHNTESFNSLTKAVEYGYINFEYIKNQKDLEWLRNHPEFDEFVKNGYRLKPKAASANTNTTTASADDIYTQLEKLGRLKEKGLITDEEFIRQKRKILG